MSLKTKHEVARKKIDEIYTQALIKKKIPMEFKYVGSEIKQNLEKEIASQVEGKCIVEGFVKPNSVKILTYSSGILNSDKVIFHVIFECLICSPMEGMYISCVAINITKAGIRAETHESPSPLVIFIARDHHYNSPYFASVKERENLTIRVIGQRFELNDKSIAIIAELIEPKLLKK